MLLTVLPFRDVQADKTRETVTDKRKRNTCVREHSRRHADIKEPLKSDPCTGAGRDNRTGHITTGSCNRKTFERDEHQKDDNKARADKTELLSHNGENKVCLGLRNIAAL